MRHARRAIVLTVGPPVAASIDDIRRRWDPVMAARIWPHVTLVHDVIDHHRAATLVAAAAASTAPIRVRLTGARHWGRPGNGIYLAVDDQDRRVADLHELLAEVERPGWVGGGYRPHVTLVHGRTVAPDDSTAAWATLDGFHAGWDVTFVAIDVLELVEPRWRRIERRTLRGRDEGAGA